MVSESDQRCGPRAPPSLLKSKPWGSSTYRDGRLRPSRVDRHEHRNRTSGRERSPRPGRSQLNLARHTDPPPSPVASASAAVLRGQPVTSVPKGARPSKNFTPRYSALPACAHARQIPSVLSTRFRSLKLSESLVANALTIPSRMRSWIRRSSSGNSGVRATSCSRPCSRT